jgi:hypothetical protein
MEDPPPIRFMRFAVFDPEGKLHTVFERCVRVDSRGIAETSHIEEIIEDMLEAQDIDYEIINPVYDKRNKIWITHQLYGTYEGYIAGFFSLD